MQADPRDGQRVTQVCRWSRRAPHRSADTLPDARARRPSRRRRAPVREATRRGRTESVERSLPYLRRAQPARHGVRGSSRSSNRSAHHRAPQLGQDQAPVQPPSARVDAIGDSESPHRRDSDLSAAALASRVRSLSSRTAQRSRQPTTPVESSRSQTDQDLWRLGQAAHDRTESIISKFVSRPSEPARDFRLWERAATVSEHGVVPRVRDDAELRVDPGCPSCFRPSRSRWHLQCLRVLFPVVYTYRESSGLTNAALIGVLVFAAPALAPLLVRVAGRRWAIVGSVVLLGALRARRSRAARRSASSSRPWSRESGCSRWVSWCSSCGTTALSSPSVSCWGSRSTRWCAAGWLTWDLVWRHGVFAWTVAGAAGRRARRGGVGDRT